MFEQKILAFDECKMRIDTNYRRCPVFLELLEGFIREKLRQNEYVQEQPVKKSDRFYG